MHIVVDGKRMEIPFVRTFADVAVGKPLLYIDSRGRVGLAVNQRSFESSYQVRVPVPLLIGHK